MGSGAQDERRGSQEEVSGRGLNQPLRAGGGDRRTLRVHGFSRGQVDDGHLGAMDGGEVKGI
ncbi:MAG TPA: hypothetical protein VK764_07065, partial [Terracidiphilus sp.]|nr:hypothetical protein [Terracidiphilus sp.]